MPRKVVRKERGVFEKVPGSDIWWIRFKDAGVEHREKVGRRGDAIKLYKIRKADSRNRRLPIASAKSGTEPGQRQNAFCSLCDTYNSGSSITFSCS